MTIIMSRDKIFLKVIKGALVPADDSAARKIRSRNFRVGDVLQADLVKLRNPAFNRLVHRIGGLASANIEAFAEMDAHEALKRIQLEGNIACDHQVVEMPGIGKCMVTIPKSLSFDAMDEGEFHETARAMCRFIAEKYWPSLTPEQIEEMAESFVGE
jgi:hypothetical protein